MNVVLIYPPISNVRYPYLSLPCLSAFLKKAGHTPMAKDVNLEAFYHMVCTPEGGSGKGEMGPRAFREAPDTMVSPKAEGEERERARSTLMKAYLTFYKGFEAEA
jgi:hypothetical protein